MLCRDLQGVDKGAVRLTVLPLEVSTLFPIHRVFKSGLLYWSPAHCSALPVSLQNWPSRLEGPEGATHMKTSLQSVQVSCNGPRCLPSDTFTRISVCAHASHTSLQSQKGQPACLDNPLTQCACSASWPVSGTVASVAEPPTLAAIGHQD